jgi:hypothetical protein
MLKNGREKYKCPYCGKLFITVSHMQNKTCQKSKTQKGGNILQTLDQAVKYGIEHSYHILYDTTLSLPEHGDDIPKVKKILSFLQGTPYDIRMYLIDTEPFIITKRIAHRHHQMVQQGFLRAVSPHMVKKWVADNRKSFEFSQTHYSPPITSFHVFDNNQPASARKSPRSKSRSRSPGSPGKSRKRSPVSHSRSPGTRKSTAADP